MTLWFISDTHFGHANIITYAQRPFATVEEMDEYMVEQWNKVVRPSDHIYHLGDVAMRQQALHAIMPRLSGHKRLIMGNHDIFTTRYYMKYFEKLKASNVFNGMLFTHIPVHERSLGRFAANVHGHTHEQDDFGPRYLNISVERVGYRPISLEEISQRVAAKRLAAVEAGGA